MAFLSPTQRPIKKLQLHLTIKKLQLHLQIKKFLNLLTIKKSHSLVGLSRRPRRPRGRFQALPCRQCQLESPLCL